VRTRDPQKEKSIHENAIKMFFREGFDGFSMQKLARVSRVSPATLYIYYKDRADLILELYASEVKKMWEAALDGFDPEMPFAQGMAIQWKNRARYFLENPLSSHFLEQIRYTPFHDRAQSRADGSFTDSMRIFVRNAIQKKELAPMPVEIYWSVAYAPLYQLLKFHMHKHSFQGTKRFVFSEKLMMQTLKLVLKALKPEEKE